MTAATLPENAAGNRKIKWLAIGIVVFLILYSAGWFLAASQIRSRLAAFLDGERTSGLSAECADMDVRGFPFRIGVFCDTVRLDHAPMAASASFGALRSAAQVYRPGHAVVELDGPAEIRVSPGLTLSADWSLLHSSVKAGFSGLERSSLSYDQLAGNVLLTAAGKSTDFAAAHGEAHLRRNGPDLDAALSVEKLELKPGKGANLLPPANAVLDITLADRAFLMEPGRLTRDALRDSKGEMRKLALDLGDGMVATASGPYSIDAEGLISGEFEVTMTNIEGWRRTLAKAFPDAEDLVENIGGMLSVLSNGGKEARVKLNVRDGTAFLAFIPIGVLPRL